MIRLELKTKGDDSMSDIITVARFLSLLYVRLGKQHNRRALAIFNEYGKFLSWDVTNVLLHALEKNKVDEVLTELEKHYQEHLVNQHPDIRGTVEDALGTNKTKIMFNNICINILQIEPVHSD